VATLLQLFGHLDSAQFLEVGRSAPFASPQSGDIPGGRGDGAVHRGRDRRMRESVVSLSRRCAWTEGVSCVNIAQPERNKICVVE
jgi:hypothetical protein